VLPSPLDRVTARLPVLAALTLVAVAGATGSSTAASVGPRAANGAQASATLTVRSGKFGRVLFDGRGRAGQILCQNIDEFGGTWLVVRPSGKLVR
jgi:hypothetical protein